MSDDSRRNAAIAAGGVGATTAGVLGARKVIKNRAAKREAMERAAAAARRARAVKGTGAGLSAAALGTLAGAALIGGKMLKKTTGTGIRGNVGNWAESKGVRDTVRKGYDEGVGISKETLEWRKKNPMPKAASEFVKMAAFVDEVASILGVI